MALSDRLSEAPRHRTGTACSVGALEDKLEGDEAAAFDAMLHQLGWSASKIHKAIVAEGHWCSEQQIGRHRSKSCGCFKDAA
jgi:hypothetical protein